MRLPVWLEHALHGAALRRPKQNRRHEYVELFLSRLEDRRVLNAAPVPVDAEEGVDAVEDLGTIQIETDLTSPAEDGEATFLVQQDTSAAHRAAKSLEAAAGFAAGLEADIQAALTASEQNTGTAAPPVTTDAAPPQVTTSITTELAPSREIEEAAADFLVSVDAAASQTDSPSADQTTTGQESADSLTTTVTTDITASPETGAESADDTPAAGVETDLAETDRADSQQESDDTPATDTGTPGEADSSSSTETSAAPTSTTTTQTELQTDSQSEESADQAETGHEVIFVDYRVTEWQSLVGEVDANTEVIILEAGRDGVDQIADALEGRDDISAVHIVSHGAAGRVYLGSSVLSGDNLAGYASAWETVGGALTDNADILFYGCNVAEGAAGAAFLEGLSSATGADTAGSTDNTGNAAFGGDWQLEAATGSIEAGLVGTAESRANFAGLLVTFIVNTTDDTVDANLGDGDAEDALGNTSLRAAIQEANALGGSHIITFSIGGSTIVLDETGAGEDLAVTGDLDITADITIDGGTDGVGIDADSIDRVFDIHAGATVVMTNLLITGGSSTAAGGGGILVGDGADLSLISSTVSSNTSGFTGGGIQILGGNLSLVGSVVSGNTGSGGGGGIRFANATSGTTSSGLISGSRITGNMGANGGGLSVSTASVTVIDTLIDGNTATTGDGGGILSSSSLTIINSTISGNSSTGSGSALLTNGSTVTVDLTHVTIAENTGASGLHTTAGTVNATNTLITNNAAGNLGGNGISGTSTTNVTADIGASLGALADNGGATVGTTLGGGGANQLVVQSHLPLAASGLIDTGTDLSGTVDTDQRGIARPQGTGYDIGAVEATSTIEVTSSNDVVNGTTTSIAALIASDGGDGISLREAIIAANNTSGADIITFHSSVAGTTITLAIAGVDEDAAATGDLDITSDITIDGGTDGVGIDADSIDRVFHIHAGATVVMTSLLITGGDATVSTVNFGGGLYITGETSVTIRNSTISQNLANSGGGIRSNSLTGGLLTIEDSLVIDNQARADGGIVVGVNSGGSPGQLTINRSRISGNRATSGSIGGLGMSGNLDVTISDSLIDGNSALGQGGGIFFSSSGVDLSIVNTTVSGNSANSGGSGIHLSSDTSTVSLTQVTIASNTGTGLFTSGAGLTATNTLIVNNGTNVDGSISSGSNNFIGTATLGALADNAGATVGTTLGSGANQAVVQSHLPDAGETQVIDQGTDLSGTVDVDQRGIARPQGAGYDIGAVEVEVPTQETTLTFAGGVLSIADSGGIVIDDALTLSFDDTTNVLTITDANGTLNASAIAGAGVSGDENAISIDLDDFTGTIDEIQVNGGDGNDLLTVDTSLNDAGITVNFVGGADSDTLNLTGSATDLEHAYTDNTSGGVLLDGSSTNFVTYSGLEPIGDTVDVSGNRIFTFSAGVDNIELSDDGTAADNVSFIDSNNSEGTTFTTPTGSLIIHALGGADTLDIQGLDEQFQTDIVIEMGDDADEVNFSGSIDIGANDLDITAETITQDAATAVTATGTTTVVAELGNVTLDETGNDFGTVIVTSANVVTLEDANDLTIGSTTTTGNYTATAGTSISITGAIATSGGNVELLAGVDVTSTAAGTITTTAAADSGTASGSVTIRSAQDTAGDIDLVGSIDTRGAANTGGAGSVGGNVTLDADDNSGGSVTLTTGTITTSGGDGSTTGGSAGAIDIDADGAVSLTAITATGGAGGSGDAGSGSTVTVTTTTGTVVTGAIDTSGGDSTSAAGGAGAAVSLDSGDDAVTAGAITTSGGEGGTTGGTAGTVAVIIDAAIETAAITAAGGAGGTGDAGSGNTVTVTTTTGTVVTGAIDSSGGDSTSAAGGAGAAVSLDSGDDTVTAGTITASGGDGSTTGGSAGAVDIDADGAVSLTAITATGGAGGSGDAGSGNTVTVTTTTGTVVTGAIDTSGGDSTSAAGGAGAAVSLGSGDDTVTTGAITTSGGEGGTTGGTAGTVAVIIDAAIETAAITATGGAGGSGAAGSGSIVTVITTTGTVVTGAIDTSGGDSTSAAGGAGAAVSLDSGDDTVTTGAITTSGGDGGTTGGMAGAVTVIIDAAIETAAITATGGAGGSGAAGSGNTVTVITTTGTVVTGAIDTSGGDSTSAAGGAGAAVSLDSGDDTVTAGTITTSGGDGGTTGGTAGTVTIDIDAAIETAAITATGGAGGSGAAGSGNTVTVTTTAGSVVTGAIDTSGGDSTSAAGGTAGSVDVFATAGIATGGINTTGGSGGSGNGGDGEFVSLQVTSGDITVSGAIDASGGNSTAAAGGVSRSILILTQDGAVTTQAITNSGGDGATGGGDSATITIQATGDVGTGDIVAAGGTGDTDLGGQGSAVSLTSSAGGVSTGIVQVSGGDSNDSNGGLGGSLVVNAAADIEVGDVTTRGGSSTDGEAGEAQSVSLNTSNGSIATDGIITSGGTSTNDAGGNAGFIDVDATASITINGTWTALGGTGGTTDGTDGLVTIDSTGGGLIDGSDPSEAANIEAGSLDITVVGDIGATGDGDIDVQLSGTASLIATGSDIFMSSDEDLEIDVLTTAAAEADTIEISTTGSANLTIDGTYTDIETDLVTFTTFEGTLTIQNNALSVGTLDLVAGDSGTGGLTATANLATTGGLTVDVEGASSITGVISGDGDLTKQGSAVLTLSGANTYTGSTSVEEGTLQNGAAGVLPDGTTVDVASGATWDLATFDETVAGLTGTGTVTNADTDPGSTVSTLTVGSGDATSTFDGVLEDNDTDSSVLALTKIGAGVFTLTGDSTYDGATTVSGGTLIVDGTIDTDETSSATVEVNTGGTLGGSGTINNIVNINDGGTLAPGGSPGTLDTESLNLDSGAAFTAELFIAAGVVTPDAVDVTGAIDLNSDDNGAGGSTLNLDLTGDDPTGATQIVLINNDGTDLITDTFRIGTITENTNGVSLATTDLDDGTVDEGDTITINGETYVFTYIGGDGNDFALVVVGTVTFTAPAGDGVGAGGTNDLELRRNGDSVQFLVGGVVQDSRPIASIQGIVVNGATNEDDTLTINYDFGGTFGDAFEITFNGGEDGGAGENDELIVTGGSFTSLTYNITDVTADNLVDGEGTLDFTGLGTITFTGLEPVTVTSALGTVTINVDDANGTADEALATTITDGGDATDGMLFLDAPGLAEDMSFTVPTVELIINGDVDDADTITIQSVDDGNGDARDFRAALTINGRHGAGQTALDTVNINSDLTLGSDVSGNTGNLTVTADTITVATTVEIDTTTATDNSATGGVGDVNLTAARNIVLNSGSGITTLDGEINLVANRQVFTATEGNVIDGDTLTITNATGDTLVFEFDDDSSLTNGTHIQIDLTGVNTDEDLAAAIVAAISGQTGFDAVLETGTNRFQVVLARTVTPSNATAVTELAGASGNFVGIDLNDADLTTGDATNGGGQITFDGRGGDTGNGNIGVSLQSSATVSSTSTDDTGSGRVAAGITILGTGGVGEDDNFGVRLLATNTEVTSVDGDISIIGQGGSNGAAGSTNNYGVFLFAGADVRSTGTDSATGTAALITIQGTGGAGEGFNHGVNIFSSGSEVTSVDGDISITGIGGADLDTDAGGPDVANGGHNNYGVFISSEAVVSSTGTDDSATGRTAALITIQGTGGTGEDSNFGVALSASGTEVTSIDGDIAITGQGGSNGDADSNTNYGVFVVLGADIRSTGTDSATGAAAQITIHGTGGAGEAFNHGVNLFSAGTEVTSVDGDISITGIGGADTDTDAGGPDVANGGSNNVGVFVASAAVVSSTGMDIAADNRTAALITIDGTGGAGDDSNIGVRVESSGTEITSVDGDISIIGQGGSNGATDSNTNYGVFVFSGADIRSTGTDTVPDQAATITITGTGGAGDDLNHGVHLFSSGTEVTSLDGDISITGTGQGTGASNTGVRIASAATVIAQDTGEATILVNGTGAAGADGVLLDGSTTAALVSESTEITVNALAGDLNMTGDARIESDSGTVRLNSVDDVHLGAVNADLNASGTGGMVLVTADTDDDGAGAITDNLSTEAANIVAMEAALRAGSGIGTDAEDINTETLSGGGATFTLAALTVSGDIHIRNDGSLTIGTVDTLVGVTITDDTGAPFTGSHTENSGDDNITLVAASPETVDDPVVNNDGGDISITALTSGDVTINADVQVTSEAVAGLDGSITVTAEGGNIVHNLGTVSTVGGSTTAGDGTITYFAEETLRIGDGVADNARAIVRTAGGNIDMDATPSAGTTVNGTGVTFSDADGDLADPDDAANQNVLVETVSGSITIDGTGISDGTTSANVGVLIDSGSVVRSTGTESGSEIGSIAINGTGGNGEGSNIGVAIGETGTLITSIDGDISITGFGGSNGLAGSDLNVGVVIAAGGVVSSTGSDTADRTAALITIDGTGGAGENTNIGVFISEVGTSETVTVDSADGVLAIPDNSTLTSTINVTNPRQISDVNVTLDITHGSVADLEVFLIAPDGTRVELVTAVPGGGSDFTGTTFDDEAGTAITTGAAPYSGSFQPEGSLSDFDGMNALGTWTLEVVNQAAATPAGTLNAWSLELTGPPSTTVTSIDGDISIRGTTGGTDSGNSGVSVGNAGVISSTGTGDQAAEIFINGTGNGEGDSNIGTVISGEATQIASIAGDVTIVGTGVQDSSGNGHIGVQIEDTARVNITGGADVIINGTAGENTAEGVHIDGSAIVGDIDPAANASDATGNIILDANAGTLSLDDATIRTTAADGTTRRIILSSDVITLADSLVQVLSAGTGLGEIVAAPDSGQTVYVELGTGADDSEGFALDETELNLLEAAVIRIGSADIFAPGNTPELMTDIATSGMPRSLIRGFETENGETNLDQPFAFGTSTEITITGAFTPDAEFATRLFQLRTNGTDGDRSIEIDGDLDLATNAAGRHFEAYAGRDISQSDDVSVTTGTATGQDDKALVDLDVLDGDVHYRAGREAELNSGSSITTLDGEQTLAGFQPVFFASLNNTTDGDTITVTALDGTVLAFEFDDDSLTGAGSIPIDFTGVTNNAELAAAIVAAIDGQAGFSAAQQENSSLLIIEPVASVDISNAAGLTDVVQQEASFLASLTDAADGDTITLTAPNGNEQVFEFDSNGSTDPGRTAIDLTGVATDEELAEAIVVAINGQAGFHAQQEVGSNELAIAPTIEVEVSNPSALTLEIAPIGNFSGVTLSDADLLTGDAGSNVGGNIQLLGRGGDTESFNIGVSVTSDSTITSDGTGAMAGTITLVGIGGAGEDDNEGVRIEGTDTLLTSTDGAITIVGTGGTDGNANSDDNDGVVVALGAEVRSTGTTNDAASISIFGRGAAGDDSNRGVEIGNSGTLVTSSDGDISITGVGGTNGDANSSSNVGVQIATGAQVTSTGLDDEVAGTTAATITITGTGRGTSSNDGVDISGTSAGTPTTIRSVDGAIVITGVSEGTAVGNAGVTIGGGAQVASIGMDVVGERTAATITIDGTGSGTDANEGVQISGTDGAGTSTTVTSIDGDISITGASTGTATVNRGVVIGSGAQITSTGIDDEVAGSTAATITIDGTGSGTSTGKGVHITGNSGGISTTVMSVDGDISITGQSTGTGSGNEGVEVSLGALVESTGTDVAGERTAAAISIDGTGSGTDDSEGVLITGTDGSGTSTTVTSLEGNISVTGDSTASGNDNAGVEVSDQASVTSTGTDADAANITVTGTGGAGEDDNHGVLVTDSGTNLTADTGNIEIVGTGGSNAAGTSERNTGVQIAASAIVETTTTDRDGGGQGRINVFGTGAGPTASANANFDVEIDGPDTHVRTMNGNINVAGLTRDVVMSNAEDSLGDPADNCGQISSVDGGITITAANDILLGVVNLQSGVFRSADVPQAFSDATDVDGTIDAVSTIEVTSPLLITDLNVELTITHDRIDDLTISLLAPDGTTRVDLVLAGDVTGADFTDTMFDDEAATAVTDGTAPFTGRFVPAGSLADFDGLDAQGTWTLEITDTAGGEDGTLVDWSLKLTGEAGPETGTFIADLGFADDAAARAAFAADTTAVDLQAAGTSNGTGAILDNRTGGISATPDDHRPNVLGGPAVFIAGSGIGNIGDGTVGSEGRIQTEITNLEGQTGTGGIVIDNLGDLVIGGIADGIDVGVETDGVPDDEPIALTAGGGDIFLNTIGDPGQSEDGDLDLLEPITNTGGGEINGTAEGTVIFDPLLGAEHTVYTSTTGIVSFAPVEESGRNFVTSQVDQLGFATVTFDIGVFDVDENFSGTIDWMDGSTTPFDLLSGSHSFTHQYISNPNPNPAAPIDFSILARNDELVNFFDSRGDLNEFLFELQFEVPGIIGSIGLQLPAELPDLPPPAAPEAPTLLEGATPVDQQSTSEGGAGLGAEEGEAERQIILRWLTVDGRTVIDEQPLTEQQLANLTQTIANLQNGFYQVIVIEAGETRERVLRSFIKVGDDFRDVDEDDPDEGAREGGYQQSAVDSAEDTRQAAIDLFWERQAARHAADSLQTDGLVPVEADRPGLSEQPAAPVDATPATTTIQPAGNAADIPGPVQGGTGRRPAVSQTMLAAGVGLLASVRPAAHAARADEQLSRLADESSTTRTRRWWRRLRKLTH